METTDKLDNVDKAVQLGVLATLKERDPKAAAAQRHLNHLLKNLPEQYKVELRKRFDNLGYTGVPVGVLIPAYLWDGQLCVQFPKGAFLNHHHDLYRVVAILKTSAPQCGFKRAFMDEESGMSYLRIVH